MQLRKLAVGGAALLVGAFTVGAASPAYAQEKADLAITFVGTTISAGVEEKSGTTEIRNLGPGTATGILVTYDINDLDTSKVSFAIDECGPPSDGVVECGIVSDTLEPDDRATFFDPITVLPGASGNAGSITASIAHAGEDPNDSNNSVTADVEISSQSGADLTVFAPDIHNEATFDEDELLVDFLDSELLPGSETAVLAYVENQGSVATGGIEMTVVLPDHVTFTFPEPECTHSVGDSTTTCTYNDLVLQPSDGSAFCDTLDSCAPILFPVRISEDAPSPASLTGGSVEAWDLGQEIFGTLGATFEKLDPELAEFIQDVDPSDNLSFFAVFVSEADDGDDNGGGGGDVGDGDGDDEPLPVTGSPVVLISGLGAALLAVGAALYLVARRRRVIPEASDG